MNGSLPSGSAPHTQFLSPDHRPLLRGWSHAIAAVAALVVTILLLMQTYADPVRFLSLLVFGLTMINLYLGSAVYHLGRWQGRRARVLRAIDHANIFLLIAGTYTPIGVNVMSGSLRIQVLSVIWIVAVAGASATIWTVRLPRWASTALYLGMGWIALAALPQLVQRLPWQAIGMLVVGGVLYSLGAVVYILKRPNLLPRVFGFHELFHLFTIAANAAFIALIWIWVVPFPRL